MEIFAVFLGGALGTLLRYFISKICPSFSGTLIANVLGCLFLGFISYIILSKNLDTNFKLFMTTGFAGGFTTFSTFCLESFKFFEANQILFGISYIFTSVFLGLLACLTGVYLGYFIINYLHVIIK